MNIVDGIFSLLEKNKEVTLPSLGKLVLEFCSAERDATTGKTYPPKYVISFDQQHNLNDCILVHELGEIEGIDKKKTEKLVAEGIASWKNILKEENTLILQGLGRFTMEGEKIAFKESKDCIFNFKNYGLPFIYISLKK